MSFLDDSEAWPRDISKQHIFLLKAVQEIGRSLSRADTRLPPFIYRYEIDLPDFAHASEEDKSAAADIIGSTLVDGCVEFSDEYIYSESQERSFLVRTSHISETQWVTANEIVQGSRTVSVKNIDNVASITSAIFQGVASAKLNAVQRAVDRPKFIPLPAETLNIDDDRIVKARLALGRVDPEKPFDLDPRGNAYIFLETKSFTSWYSSVGRSHVRVGIARRSLMRLAERHRNHLPGDLNKGKLLSKEFTSFDLDEREVDVLWDSLPDRPFKRQGLRQGASRNGRL